MSEIDIQRQLDTATAFFLAGERNSRHLQFDEYETHTVDGPAIVCYAFAVEVALKLIGQLSIGKAIRGHSLKALLTKLPKEMQSKLQFLSECVDGIDAYFESWRYDYERELLFGEFDNPRRSFICCYRVIRELRPDLQSCYEHLWGSFEPDWDSYGRFQWSYRMERVVTE